MATVKTVLKADNKTRAGLESAKKGMTGYRRAVDKQIAMVKRTLKSVGPAIKAVSVGLVAATALVTALTVASVAAANEQEAAEVKRAAAIGRTSKALDEQAVAIQRVTTVGDEAVIQAQAAIGAFVKEDEAIAAATQAAIDLSAGLGISLKSAADLVAKSLGSSTNALTRYGIEVKGAVGSTERLSTLTGNIADKFGGQAAAAALTFGGRVKQLSNAFGDVLEQIGFVVTKNQGFNDTVKTGIEQLQLLGKHIEDNRQKYIDFANKGLNLVIKTLKAGLSFIDDWITGFNLITKTIDDLGKREANLAKLRGVGVKFGAETRDFMAGIVDDTRKWDEALKQLARGNDLAFVKQALAGMGEDATNVAQSISDVKGPEIDPSIAGAIEGKEAMSPEAIRISEKEANLAMLEELSANEISLELYTQEELTKIAAQQSKARLDVGATFAQNLVTIGGALGKKGLALQKAFAIRSTIIETWASAQKSYSSLAGIPIIGPALGAAAAAAAITAGFIRVNAIKSESSGGGSGGGAPSISSAGGASPTATQPAPQQAGGFNQEITIEISGDVLDPETLLRGLAVSMEKLSTRDGVNFGFKPVENR